MWLLTSYLLLFSAVHCFPDWKMKVKQIDQLKRAQTWLRDWMTRDINAVKELMESDSPEVMWVEEKLNAIMTRLQKAEDLQMEIEKLLADDEDVQVEVEAQGPWFDMLSQRTHDVQVWLKEQEKKQRQSTMPVD